MSATRAELSAIRDSLNDEHGIGGKRTLVRLLDRCNSIVRQKLNGKSPINQSYLTGNQSSGSNSSTTFG